MLVIKEKFTELVQQKSDIAEFFIPQNEWEMIDKILRYYPIIRDTRGGADDLVEIYTRYTFCIIKDMYSRAVKCEKNCQRIEEINKQISELEFEKRELEDDDCD